ncbi:MAG TPA: DUF1232 domain-containing protein, partial [Thermomicrobiales bacterium]|nr:DUF1232 domain-containing protein [Thermomicrobiales bacterium]
MKSVARHWKTRARQLKQLVMTLYFASRDPRTPPIARIVGICVVAYGLSPIDLIPDFIPVLGLLDDLILLPLGIALAIRLIPRDVWTDAQAKSAEISRSDRPTNWIAAVIIVFVWIV